MLFISNKLFIHQLLIRLPLLSYTHKNFSTSLKYGHKSLQSHCLLEEWPSRTVCVNFEAHAHQSASWPTRSLSGSFGPPQLPHIRSSYSPAQMLMSRRLRSKVPTAPLLLCHRLWCSSVFTQQTTTPKTVLWLRHQASAASQRKGLEYGTKNVISERKQPSFDGAQNLGHIGYKLNTAPSPQLATPAKVTSKHLQRI